MSPTVRHDPRSFALDHVTSAPDPARVRCYAFALVGVSVALLVAIVSSGAELPDAGLVLWSRSHSRSA
jgi:hypothetical protein